LSEWEEIESRCGTTTYTISSKTRIRRTISGNRSDIGVLEYAAGNVCTGSLNIRFDAPVIAGTTAGEANDVIGVVGTSVSNTTAIRAAKRLNIFGCTDAQAEKTMTISWLPAAGKEEPAGCASRTSASYACESVL
jgi:hypothetical protein